MPCPPPGDLPDTGIEPTSLGSAALAGGFFTAEPPGTPTYLEQKSNLLTARFLLFFYTSLANT